MRVQLSVHGQCECKAMLMRNHDSDALFCSNVDCPQYGKKFKYPEVELEEVI